MKITLPQALKTVLFTVLIGGGVAQAQSPTVSITQKAPAEVVAGNAFDLTFTIQKGDVNSFARIKQALPTGFTADFAGLTEGKGIVKDNQARLVFLSLPESDLVNVTYTIKVDKDLKGTFALGGEFNYTEDNVKKTAFINPTQVNIVGGATANN